MESHITPQSRTFVSHRLQLHYLDWGNEGTPILILQHGGKDHAHSWDMVARHFARDWHVIAPDLRGHGDSAWSMDGAYASPFFVADMAALLSHLGGEPVAMVAHSLGAAVALRQAGIMPESFTHLVAIEGLGLEDHFDRLPVEQRWQKYLHERAVAGTRQTRRYERMEDAVARMMEANGHLHEDLARHLTEHAVRPEADGMLAWKYDPALTLKFPEDISGAERRALWQRIDVPVWLVHGGESWAKHPAEDGRAAEFSNAQVTSFARAGHWVQHDRFEDFVALLDRFLRDGANSALPDVH